MTAVLPDTAPRTDSLSWRDRGLCAETDPELFFPEKGDSVSARLAVRVCQGCEVRAECLQYALENSIRFGVWGGMTERERRAVAEVRRER